VLFPKLLEYAQTIGLILRTKAVVEAHYGAVLSLGRGLDHDGFLHDLRRAFYYDRLFDDLLNLNRLLDDLLDLNNFRLAGGHQAAAGCYRGHAEKSAAGDLFPHVSSLRVCTDR